MSFPVKAGKTYRVTFEAKATQDHIIEDGTHQGYTFPVIDRKFVEVEEVKVTEQFTSGLVRHRDSKRVYLIDGNDVILVGTPDGAAVQRFRNEVRHGYVNSDYYERVNV